jgi:hypothetical protein
MYKLRIDWSTTVADLPAAPPMKTSANVDAPRSCQGGMAGTSKAHSHAGIEQPTPPPAQSLAAVDRKSEWPIKKALNRP